MFKAKVEVERWERAKARPRIMVLIIEGCEKFVHTKWMVGWIGGLWQSKRTKRKMILTDIAYGRLSLNKKNVNLVKYILKWNYFFFRAACARVCYINFTCIDRYADMWKMFKCASESHSSFTENVSIKFCNVVWFDSLFFALL